MRLWLAVAIAIIVAGLLPMLLWSLPLGRADPLLALPMLGMAGFAAAWAAGRLSLAAAIQFALVLALVLAGSWALFGLLMASRVSVGQTMGLAGAYVVSFVAMAAALAQRADAGLRRLVGTAGAFVLALAAFFGAGPVLSALYTPPIPASPVRVTMLTSLPLVWNGAATVSDALAVTSTPDPAYALITDQFRVTPVDAVTPVQLARTDVLLLAHPRAMAPAELVAVDTWVQQGGRALILADALSASEPPYPLGDPRNPPITSLLTPLLDHWDINLVAPPVADEVTVMRGTERLHLYAAGVFDRVPPSCTPTAERRIIDCRNGRGRVMAITDADLLAAQWWDSPGDPWVHRRADNMLWIVQSINALSGARVGSPLATPLWIC